MPKEKMTLKEFKKIFNDAGLDFKIWGYEGILNEIAIAEEHMEDETDSDVLKKMYKSRRQFIYDALKARGFYD